MAKVPYLSNLGITEIDQAQPPTADAYPAAFNPLAKYIWDEVVVNALQSNSPLLDWTEAIRDFVRECEARDVFAFADPKPVNASIFNDMLSARQQMIQTAKGIGLEQVVKPTRSETRVVLTGQGFQICGKGFFRTEDPSLDAWAQSHGFTMNAIDKAWHRGVNSQCDLILNIAEGWVGFSLTINAWPAVPRNPMPSQAELEQFVLVTMWEPLRMSHKFEGWALRAF